MRIEKYSCADNLKEKAGNATRQIGSAASHGRIGYTSIIKQGLTTRSLHRETLVSLQALRREMILTDE